MMKFTIRLFVIVSLLLTSQSFFAQEVTISSEKVVTEAKKAAEHQKKINKEQERIKKHQNDLKNAQKSISGGIPLCVILCGEAGGVISNTPGRGDVCQPGTTVCCYCR